MYGRPMCGGVDRTFLNWGSGKNVLTYRERTRCQSRGFRSGRLRPIVLDPWRKILYGIEDNEQGLWTIVSQQAVAFRWPTRVDRHVPQYRL